MWALIERVGHIDDDPCLLIGKLTLLPLKLARVVVRGRKVVVALRVLADGSHRRRLGRVRRERRMAVPSGFGLDGGGGEFAVERGATVKVGLVRDEERLASGSGGKEAEGVSR